MIVSTHRPAGTAAIAACALLTLLPGPAAALVPPMPYCVNPDGSEASFLFTHDENDDQMPGLTTFLTTDTETGQELEVYVFCASGEALSFPAGFDEVGPKLAEDAIRSERRVTLRQLRNILRRAGVDARYGTLAEGHCACRPETHDLRY